MKLPKHRGRILLVVWLILFGIQTAPFLKVRVTYSADVLKEVPEVHAIRMLSGALLADSFEGPRLDTQTWHRPDWLVKNDPNLSVGIHHGHLRISGVSRPTGRDHQYTGVLSSYFRETDVVLSARIRAA